MVIHTSFSSQSYQLHDGVEEHPVREREGEAPAEPLTTNGSPGGSTSRQKFKNVIYIT
jgi:hypothetical protein